MIKEISVDKAECDWARLNKSIFNMEHGRIIKWILDVISFWILLSVPQVGVGIASESISIIRNTGTFLAVIHFVWRISNFTLRLDSLTRLFILPKNPPISQLISHPINTHKTSSLFRIYELETSLFFQKINHAESRNFESLLRDLKLPSVLHNFVP